MKPGLLELQSQVQAHVLGRAPATAAIQGTTELATQRLGIYKDAYRLRLMDVLADTYPKSALAMGPERFERVCLRYIDAHTPTTRSLRWYGDELADRLREWAPASGHWHELAQLEWALRGAFDGPDAPALRASSLVGLVPEDWAVLGFELHPTVQWLEFRHNAVAVWQALNDEQAAPDWQHGAEATTWLVWRKALQPHFRSVPPFEARLLTALQSGMSFAQACAAASAVEADAEGDPETSAAQQIGACLRQWLDDELLCRVTGTSAVT